MMINSNKIVQFLKAYITNDARPHIIARSICLANYIAFSPFLGLHTVMVFLFGWLFSLNIPLMLAISHTVNNPWSAIPIYTLDYLFGVWFMGYCGTFDFVSYTPCWLLSIEKTCAHYTGFTHFSFWTFFIGGNLLGILISLCMYPVVLRICEKVVGYKRQVSPL